MFHSFPETEYYQITLTEIILSDDNVIKHESNQKAKDLSIRRATLLRAPINHTLWPGDHLEVDKNNTYPGDKECKWNVSGHNWIEPGIVRSVQKQ